jgi:hypothetical protein
MVIRQLKTNTRTGLSDSEVQSRRQVQKAKLGRAPHVLLTKRAGKAKWVPAEALVQGDVVFLRLGTILPAPVRILSDPHEAPRVPNSIPLNGKYESRVPALGVLQQPGIPSLAPIAPVPPLPAQLKGDKDMPPEARLLLEFATHLQEKNLHVNNLTHVEKLRRITTIVIGSRGVVSLNQTRLHAVLVGTDVQSLLAKPAEGAAAPDARPPEGQPFKAISPSRDAEELLRASLLCAEDGFDAASLTATDDFLSPLHDNWPQPLPSSALRTACWRAWKDYKHLEDVEGAVQDLTARFPHRCVMSTSADAEPLWVQLDTTTRLVRITLQFALAHSDAFVSYASGDQERPTSPEYWSALAAAQRDLLAEGSCLSILYARQKRSASTPYPANPQRPLQASGDDDELKELCILGALSFIDPMRDLAVETFEELAKLGIRVIATSSDDVPVCRSLMKRARILTKETAEDIAQREGIPLASVNQSNVKALITHRSALLSQLGSNELDDALLKDELIFCRVTPQQKAYLVDAMRNRGDIVAVVAESPLDVPCLQKADVSFAFHTASSDVCKQAADLIVLDDRLPTLAYALFSAREAAAKAAKVIQQKPMTRAKSVDSAHHHSDGCCVQ